MHSSFADQKGIPPVSTQPILDMRSILDGVKRRFTSMPCQIAESTRSDDIALTICATFASGISNAQQCTENFLPFQVKF
jgi:hypothetical protein